MNKKIPSKRGYLSINQVIVGYLAATTSTESVAFTSL